MLFKGIFVCLINNKVLDTIEHPNKEKYPNQRIFIIGIEDYVYLVPFVEDEKIIFLKRTKTLSGDSKKQFKKR